MTSRVAAIALLLTLTVLSGAQIGAAQQDQAVADLSPEVVAQIDALIAEKESRTAVQQKIDSQLLYEGRMEAGEPVATGLWAVETDLPYASDGHLVVDVRAREGSTIASRLPGIDVELVSVSDDGANLRVHLNVDEIEALASDPDVLFVQPRQTASVAGQDAAFNLVAPTGQGSRTSEGDVTHLAFAARGAFHVDGTGIKIGVLSNGVSSLADSQARGDLGPVTVLPGQGGLGDEGTAMLEIVHDLAPGAQLYFATGSTSITSFANNIRALRAAGCDIIVDDVFYFVETPFQDGQAPAVVSPTNGGVVIQAVKDVVASGALYFSSAGNSGNADSGNGGTWEGDFADSGTTLLNGRVHKFGNQAFNTLTVANTDGVSPISLFWSDPLGGSANDYDLFRLNAAGNAVAASSTNIQNGRQDPIEQVSQNIANPRIVVTRKTTALPRFLHLETNRGRLSIATAGATHGHAAVTGAGAYGIAATAASAAFPQPFSSANLVEPFSSDGPRRIFFTADGTPITPDNLLADGGQVLQKPDLTAADGVTVSGVGGFGSPFNGTSAAAPHAAAIAALVKAANPGLSASQVRAILTTSAIDIQPAGIDRDSGAGIIMARDALTQTGIKGDAFVQLDALQWKENPGNNDGVVEPGEGAQLVVTLKNYGVAPATGIQALFTSPTPGITIAAPNARAFPDLAPMQAAVETSPSLITIGNEVSCATAATFRVDATYVGGTALSQELSFPLGLRTITVRKALDGTTPSSIVPGVVGAAGIQNFRLNRDGVVSACTAPKATPTIAAGVAAARSFDAYTIRTCENSAPACATVQLDGPNATALFTAAYVPVFDPADIQRNYRADPGASATSRTYSFIVPGGGSTFAVDVHDVTPGPPSGTAYTLTVSGVCTGSCDPPNRPPTVRAANVTVAANDRCVADASIDNGSIDADGDRLTSVQSPAGPYALGTTPVLLTDTDPKGAFGQASATVTVVDRTAPSITGLAVTPSVLWPPNHRLVDIGVAFDAADNCGAATCVLTVSDNQARTDGDGSHESGDSDDGPDVIVVDAHHVRVRSERRGGVDRVYTLTLTCTDAAGNKTVRTATVTVPHDSSDDYKSLNSGKSGK
jgi:hypothetical protein